MKYYIGNICKFDQQEHITNIETNFVYQEMFEYAKDNINVYILTYNFELMSCDSTMVCNSTLSIVYIAFKSFQLVVGFIHKPVVDDFGQFEDNSYDILGILSACELDSPNYNELNIN